MSTTSGHDLAQTLDDTYRLLTATVDGLADQDFARPTRAAAWNVKELLFHQLLDAQRALAAFATTTDAAPDVDAVTYWRPFRPSAGDGGAAHARMVQVGASAFARPAGLVEWWRVFAEATPRAARSADPDARIETQGHVLDVPALISTLVVEATVHYLDLIVSLPAAGPPPEAALAETRRMLAAILGAEPPVRWDLETTILKGTGRLPLDEADLTDLGARASRVPLLG